MFQCNDREQTHSKDYTMGVFSFVCARVGHFPFDCAKFNLQIRCLRKKGTRSHFSNYNGVINTQAIKDTCKKNKTSFFGFIFLSSAHIDGCRCCGLSNFNFKRNFREQEEFGESITCQDAYIKSSPTEDDPFISRHICVPVFPESNPDRLLTIPVAATGRFSLFNEFSPNGAELTVRRIVFAERVGLYNLLLV